MILTSTLQGLPQVLEILNYKSYYKSTEPVSIILLETPLKEQAASLEGSDAHVNLQYYTWLIGQQSSSVRLEEEG